MAVDYDAPGVTWYIPFNAKTLNPDRSLFTDPRQGTRIVEDPQALCDLPITHSEGIPK